MNHFCFLLGEPCMLQNILRVLKVTFFYNLPPQEGLDMSSSEVVNCQKNGNCNGTAFCIIFEFQTLQVITGSRPFYYIQRTVIFPPSPAPTPSNELICSILCTNIPNLKVSHLPSPSPRRPPLSQIIGNGDMTLYLATESYQTFYLIWPSQQPNGTDMVVLISI